MSNPFEEIVERLSKIEHCLLDLKSSPAARPQLQEDRWMSLEGLCNYLPDSPAKQTIYGKVSRNEIPYHKRGKSLTFLKSEIDAWLKGGRRKTNDEIAAEASAFLSTKKRRG